MAAQDGIAARGLEAARHHDVVDRRPPTKRMKIALACDECRSRKVRCDGAQPICSSCRHRRRPAQRPCVYLSDRNIYPPGYVDRLESRLRQLEADRAQDAQKHASKEESGIAHTANLSLNPVTSLLSSNPMLSDGSNESDAMGNISVGCEDKHDDRTPNSSTASFVKHIRHALTLQLQTPRNQRRGASERRLMPQHNEMSLSEALMLPSRRIADSLMAVYWADIHILYPFVVKTQFTVSYQKLWTGELDSVQERRFGALLNTILALCSRAYKSTTRSGTAVEGECGDGAGKTEADVYFRRATRLLQLELFGQGSVEQIQALLLTALYLQSTEWPQSCWTAVGLAIRIAQGMDLHAGAHAHKQVDREQSRRLWHGCVLLDKIVAMTLGRPAALSGADATAAPLPAPIDDECLSTELGEINHQPTGTPSYVEFYVQSMRLYEIQATALSALQKGRSGHAGSQINPQRTFPRDLDDINFGAVFDFDSLHQRWTQSLPEHLTFDNENHTGCCFKRQATILHLRQLQVQILLLRPVVSILMKPELRSKISAASNDPSTLPLSLEMAMACASRCARASQAVVNTIWDEQLKNAEDPLSLKMLPAWWFQVFFVYTAATAIIPAYLFSELRGSISRASIMRTWHRALVLLGRLSQHSSTARRCMAVLQYVSAASNYPVEPDDASIPSRSSTSMQDNPSDQNLGVSTTIAAPQGVDFSYSGFGSSNEYIDHSIEEFLADEVLDFTWLDSLPAAGDLGSLQLF